MQLLKELMGYKRYLSKNIKDEKAQSTLEFALIFAGFLALCTSLGVIIHACGSGLLVDGAINCSAHQLKSTLPGIISDVFLV